MMAAEVRRWSLVGLRPLAQRAGLFASVLLVACGPEGPAELDRAMEASQRGDYAEAYCVWRPLAANGHREAQYNLGWLYANGHGLRLDLEKAVYWWERAAAQGHVEAEFAVALAYATGGGIARDLQRAVDWYLRAASNGHEEARDVLRGMLRRQVPEALARMPALVAASWLGSTRQVVRDKANARAGPGTGEPVVAQLALGIEVLEVSREGEWSQVVLDDPLRLVWVHSSLLD